MCQLFTTSDTIVWQYKLGLSDVFFYITVCKPLLFFPFDFFLQYPVL